MTGNFVFHILTCPLDIAVVIYYRMDVLYAQSTEGDGKSVPEFFAFGKFML